MPVSIITGGQYGSEGKGKVSCWLAEKQNADVVVRIGGSNSGHTVIDKNGNKFVFRVLPTAAIIPSVVCVLGAGSYINLPILLKEIEMVKIDKCMLLIDANAVIVSDEDETDEKSGSLISDIGSTGSGTGTSVIKRILRNGKTVLAKDVMELSDYVSDSVPYLRHTLNKNRRIIIEGTQGFGLSLLHSPHYPYTTSRDTTAAGFLSETGLSPLDVDQIVMVLRSYPIRVGGNSGPMGRELNWDLITKKSGYTTPLIEYTSVTNRVRRIAEFDAPLVRSAIEHDNPTMIVMNHMDYIDEKCRSEKTLTPIAIDYIEEIEKQIRRKIDYVGVDPQTIVPMRHF